MKSEYDDHRRPLLRALKFGWIGLAAVTLVSLAAWGAMRHVPGMWGVILGAAIGGGFLLMTVASVLATSGTSVSTTGAVVLGGWLLKIVVLIIVLVFLRGQDFYDKLAFFVTVVLVLVVVLASEVWGVITSKVTYTS